ncbi:methionine-rich copper-binding protein CopC [Mycetocola sp. BIGb0189]|uniref:copper resistance CopC family protein n=1 Tax=Mycetocola sp. BIGb0189 TaxID=2940604 RepID=UPI002168EC8B|nr:copper resistance CopC family protein [Mycetocola sp. BIGb0189]MCS4277889.1 methionine-rich copper-binding protein CopC [Mycetocola sp. BIGb0189]
MSRARLIALPQAPVRTALIVILGLVLALAGLMLSTPAAQAHNTVVSEYPAAKSTVTEQPGQIVVTTNDNLTPIGVNTAIVVGPDGKHYASGCGVVNGPALTMPAELGPAGTYTVTWQVVSTDGHPISGDFTFDWQPAAGQKLGTGQTERPVCSSAEPGEGTVTTQGTDATPQTGSDAASAAPGEEVGPNVRPHTAAMDDIGWIVVAIGVVLFGGLVLLVLLLVQRRRSDVAREEAEKAKRQNP